MTWEIHAPPAKQLPKGSPGALRRHKEPQLFCEGFPLNLNISTEKHSSLRVSEDAFGSTANTLLHTLEILLTPQTPISATEAGPGGRARNGSGFLPLTSHLCMELFFLPHPFLYLHLPQFSASMQIWDSSVCTPSGRNCNTEAFWFYWPRLSMLPWRDAGLQEVTNQVGVRAHEHQSQAEGHLDFCTARSSSLTAPACLSPIPREPANS